ncbi:MAG: hypothetical protein JNL74_08700 [Fibrobacteres bacterium]|nr:hypothetical protein [Fibrobacterota bacterium]
MKLFRVLLSALLLAGMSQAATPVDTLVVTARLVEIPGKFTPNDIYNYVYIMKYRVVKVEKGTYAEKDILVGHYNPLIARGKVKGKMAAFTKGDVASFTEGQTHKLTLIQPMDLVWKDNVQDEYFDSELTKFYCLRADGVKAAK